MGMYIYERTNIYTYGKNVDNGSYGLLTLIATLAQYVWVLSDTLGCCKVFGALFEGTCLGFA